MGRRAKKARPLPKQRKALLRNEIYHDKVFKKKPGVRLHMPIKPSRSAQGRAKPSQQREDQIYNIRTLPDGGFVAEHSGFWAHLCSEGQRPLQRVRPKRHSSKGVVVVGGKPGDFEGEVLLSTSFRVVRAPQMKALRKVHAPMTRDSKPHSKGSGKKRGIQGIATFLAGAAAGDGGASGEEALSSGDVEEIRAFLNPTGGYHRPHPTMTRTRAHFLTRGKYRPYQVHEWYPDLPPSMEMRGVRDAPRAFAYIIFEADGKAPCVANFLLSLAICGIGVACGLGVLFQ